MKLEQIKVSDSDEGENQDSEMVLAEAAANDLAETQEVQDSDDQSQKSYMNSQAFGMLYWSLAKIMGYPRTRFHKNSELFLSKCIEQMLADPENYSSEDPILIFDQMVQTCGVMAYTQSYITNIKITNRCLDLVAQTLEVRNGLSTKQYDFDKKEFKPIPLNLKREDLRRPDWRMLVHLKLILTSLAKNRKYFKKQQVDDQHKNIIRLATKLVLDIKAPLPNSPKQQQAIVGNLS